MNGCYQARSLVGPMAAEQLSHSMPSFGVLHFGDTLPRYQSQLRLSMFHHMKMLPTAESVFTCKVNAQPKSRSSPIWDSQPSIPSVPFHTTKPQLLTSQSILNSTILDFLPHHIHTTWMNTTSNSLFPCQILPFLLELRESC